MNDISQTTPPKIAVIGAGYWGKNLVRNYAALGGALTMIKSTAILCLWPHDWQICLYWRGGYCETGCARSCPDAGNAGNASRLGVHLWKQI